MAYGNVNVPGVIAAELVKYDHEASGLAAQDVQGAVDELAARDIFPRVSITAPGGSTVTITGGGGETFTPTGHEGVWEQDIPSFGTYTVTAKVRNETFTRTLEVDAARVYRVWFSDFEAYIRIFAPPGATVTCSGEETQTIISTGDDAISVYAPGTYTVTRNINGLKEERGVEITKSGETVTAVLSYRYGYRKRKAEADPYARTEYLHDAVGKTPAHMDFENEAFDYGDWADAWFVAKNRPVMLKSDLTEDYELDHDDQTKKLGGGESDISNTGYDGNAMSAIPLCWFHRYEDEEYEYEIVCEHQWDENYKAYAHTDADGRIMDCFYWSMFGGSSFDGKIRSLSGQSLAQSLDTTTQIERAEANGDGWYIHSWSRRECIRTLLVLMAKSTNTQAAYGNGNCRNTSSSSGLLKTGTLADNGQFWGSSANNRQIKVFYIEGFWGDQWLRTAGIINNYGQIFCKMTPEDGGYQIDNVNGYTGSGITLSGTSNGYISETKCGEFGCIPTVISGSDSTYECDGGWYDNGQRYYFLAGASANITTGLGGAFAFRVNLASDTGGWNPGCGLSADMKKEG